MQICLPIACRAPRTKPPCSKRVKTRAANLSTILADRKKKMAQEERRGGPSEEESPRMRDEGGEISFVAEFRHFVNLKIIIFCCKFHFSIKKLPNSKNYIKICGDMEGCVRLYTFHILSTCFFLFLNYSQWLIFFLKRDF